MNLQELREGIPSIEECLVLGRPFASGSCTGCVIGLTRQGEQAKLYFLQYDDTYGERLEEAELSAMDNPPKPPATLREELVEQEQSQRQTEPRLTVEHLRSVEIGGVAYPVSGSSYRAVEGTDWEGILLLETFLRAGWRPEGILTEAPLERCFLLEAEIGRSLPSLGDISTAGPVVLMSARRVESYLVQKPLRLQVGDGRGEAVTFGGDGAEHAVYLHRAYLYDPYEAYREMYRQYRARPGLTAEERTAADRAEESLYELLPSVCPEGMLLPVVEYETAEGLSLDIRARSVLDGPPPTPSVSQSGGGPVVSSASSMLFLAKADQEAGRHGLPLRAAVVEVPVPPGTEEIDAELFRWHRSVTPEPLVL